MEVIRATEEYQRAGAYYVRIQAMARQHHIPLPEEFDAIDGPGCRYIVILDDGFPVATCRWFEVAAGAVEIGRVVVLPDYRGRHLGVLLMSEAERWIRESGYRKIVLSSRVGVEKFYEKLGYGYNAAHQAHSGTFRCVYMEKELTG
jgi:GNAT superfamily N-acetyltransferase